MSKDEQQHRGGFVLVGGARRKTPVTMCDYQLVWDYDEFVDCYFLQGDDDADSLRKAEHE